MGYETKDSGARQEYASGMRRDLQTGKPRYDLIPEPMLTRWAELMERGSSKYGERNWEKAESEEELVRFVASAFRHFVQWWRNDTDEDHASAVMFNIAAAEMVKEKLNESRTIPSPSDTPSEVLTRPSDSDRCVDL